MKQYICHIVFFFLWFAALPSAGFQAEGPVGGEPVFDRDTWQDKVDKADYFRERDRRESRQDEAGGNAPRGLGELNLGPLKYILLALVFAILVVVLLRVFASELFRRPKRAVKAGGVAFADLEADLEAAPLHRLLEERLAAGDYRSAVRLYYLMVLRGLKRAGLIEWKRDKTDSQYLSELRGRPEYEEFRMASRSFARVWYGPVDTLDRAEFERIEPVFRELLSSVGKPEKKPVA